MASYSDLLNRLIRCKAVSGEVAHVNSAVAVMREYLSSKHLFCQTELLDGREILYASTEPGKVQDILFNAHLDVVPAPDSMFEPVEKDGKLYARGSSDCQGNAVAVAEILCNLRGRASAAAVFSTDEEIGGETTRAMVERGYSARKMVIILDASPYRIAHAQKGIISLTLRAQGKGGHASEPWILDNPIDRLIDGYLRLRGAWDSLPEDHWGNTMTPCILSAGKVPNQVPDSAEMILNIRYVREEDHDVILEKVKSVTGLEVIVNMTSEPAFVDEKHPLMQKLKNAMAEKFGREIEFYRMHGATDARHFVKLGIPIAILGTEGEGMHSASEWVELRNLDEYIELLTDFVLNLRQAN